MDARVRLAVQPHHQVLRDDACPHPLQYTWMTYMNKGVLHISEGVPFNRQPRDDPTVLQVWVGAPVGECVKRFLKRGSWSGSLTAWREDGVAQGRVERGGWFLLADLS